MLQRLQGSEKKRVAFAWVPTKRKTAISADMNGGGDFIAHEINQKENGKLIVKPAQYLMYLIMKRNQ